MTHSEPPAPQLQRCTLARWMAAVFILLTAAISLTWSHAKLLSQDEMYAFQTDRVPGFANFVHVQKQWPISLDPLLYHALSHGGMQIFGVGPFALRLPSFLGFLLMQACLFFFVRNIAGDRAGTVAAALPALTATLYYAAEGRPYGLLLGLYAFALLCYQLATRALQANAQISSRPSSHTRSQTSSRTWPLIGLAVALAAALNAHYFGILLLAPLWAAEAWRTYTRRRAAQIFDWPVPLTLFIGTAAIIFTKPFMPGAAEFKKHYYNAGGVGIHDITRAYRTLFLDYTKMPIRTQHIAMVLLVLYAAALLWGCWRAFQTRTLRISSPEWLAVLTMAALPFGGYLLARFVTHSIEVRYVLGALVALSAMTAFALAPYLRRDALFNAALVVLGLGILLGGIARISAEQRATNTELASLTFPQQLVDAINQSPTRLLYIQDMGTFQIASYYEPDPDIRSRIALVFDEADELRYDQHDTMTLTAQHMQHFSGLRIVPYAALRTEPGPHIFLLAHSGWDWTDGAFAEDHATVTPLGKAAGADAATVTFASSR